MTIEQITLRLAEEQDARNLFTWRNDPEIVALGSTQKTVSWSEHSSWFQRMTDHTRHLVFLIEINGNDGGMVRLDRMEETEASISTYLLPQYTGRGLGPLAIHQACAKGTLHWHPRLNVHASIRRKNKNSIRAFERAGFRKFGRDIECPPDHTVLTWRAADNGRPSFLEGRNSAAELKATMRRTG